LLIGFGYAHQVRTRLAAVVLALLSLVFSEAAARSRVDNSPEGIASRVRKHLASARTHFRVGEFDKAVKEWKYAYKLKPIPVLQFNIAQAYRLGGHYEDARFAYRQYLDELPDPPNKAEVESRIRVMSRYIHHPPAGAGAK
jgi:tetratricopeptide (TPR) repeat protein